MGCPGTTNGNCCGNDQHHNQPAWRKASYSAVDNCVELANTGTAVALRNSRDPDGPTLVFSRPELLAFARGIAAGEFDDLLHPQHDPPDGT